MNPLLGPRGTYSEYLTGVKLYGAGRVGAAQTGKLGSAGYNERERGNRAKKRAAARTTALRRA